MPPRDRQRYELVLVDAGGAEDAPVVIRLRAALKRLLRAFSLRCVRVVEVKPAEQPVKDPPS